MRGNLLPRSLASSVELYQGNGVDPNFETTREPVGDRFRVVTCLERKGPYTVRQDEQTIPQLLSGSALPASALPTRVAAREPFGAAL